MLDLLLPPRLVEIAFLGSLGGDVVGEIPLAIDFAFADPYFDTYAAYLCISNGESVVDVSPKGVQRNPAFLEGLGACHLGAIETTGDYKLDAFCAHPHCRCDSCLDCAPVSNLAFNLPCDIVGYDYCVEFLTLDFEDVDLYVLLGDVLEFLFDLIDLLSAFADDDPSYPAS